MGVVFFEKVRLVECDGWYGLRVHELCSCLRVFVLDESHVLDLIDVP